MDKHVILREIKRTAEANGGVPLGMEKFARATGITVADWGKLWVRWGDAVREAGYEPNKLQGAYDASDLLERFISLMRELRRFPVFRELDMKHRQDRTFPSSTVFNRFGNKRDIAAAVIKHVEACEGYEDIIAMCQAVTEGGASVDASDEGLGDLPAENFGFVYLVKSGRYYKVGRSDAPGRREYDIGRHRPEGLTTLHVIRTDDPQGIENYWKSRFAERTWVTSGST